MVARLILVQKIVVRAHAGKLILLSFLFDLSTGRRVGEGIVYCKEISLLF